MNDNEIAIRFGDSINLNFSLTISDLVFDIVGRLNHTSQEWEVPELNMNFTITGIRGGFDNLTDNFFNELLNLSGPEILELAWPGLQPSVEETVAEVSITQINDRNCMFVVVE